MSVNANLRLELTVRETLEANVAGASQKTIIHATFNQTKALHASSTPVATKGFGFEVTLSAGTASIDLRSLTGPNGACDLNGLKVQAMLFVNPGSNPITVAPAGANPYPLFGTGNSVVVPAGGSLAFYFPEGLPDVSATVKALTLTGTGTDKLQINFAAG